MSDSPKKLSQPRPALTFLESAGPRELFYPPAQQILSDAKSWLNQPYALIAGFRLLRLDVHVPEDRKGPVPVIIFAPGGAWLVAPKNHTPWRQLLAGGYAVVSIEYRLSGEAQFPAQLHDVKAAIRWVRQNAAAYGLDPERVAGWGCSAGGYLMSMAGVTNGMEDFEGDVGEALDQSSHLSAIITHYAPSELLTMGEDTNGIPGAVEQMGTATAPESLLLGYVPHDRPDEAARASVTSYVRSDTVPFLIMHGDADARLGIDQSRRLRDAMAAVGAGHEFHIVEGANHADPKFEEPAIIERIADFLRRTL